MNRIMIAITFLIFVVTPRVNAKPYMIGSVSWPEAAEAAEVVSAADDSASAKGISGSAEFGMVNTNGNSKTKTTTAKFSFTDDRKHWRHQFTLDALMAQDKGIATSERYRFSVRSDRKMRKGQFLFVGAGLEIDKFSGFDSQSTLVIGYGKDLVSKAPWSVSANAGPGYRYSISDAGAVVRESLVHVSAKARYTFSEPSYLESSLTSEKGSQQTITVFNLAFVSKINESLAFKARYNLKNNSNPPDGIENVDSITSISLLYGF